MGLAVLKGHPRWSRGRAGRGAVQTLGGQWQLPALAKWSLVTFGDDRCQGVLLWTGEWREASSPFTNETTEIGAVAPSAPSRLSGAGRGPSHCRWRGGDGHSSPWLLVSRVPCLALRPDLLVGVSGPWTESPRGCGQNDRPTPSLRSPTLVPGHGPGRPGKALSTASTWSVPARPPHSHPP